MTELADLACPIMRRRAGFHRNNALRQLGEEGKDLSTGQPPAQDNRTIASSSVYLKHSLCQVQADNANFLHGCSLL
jgi:hypothetical protein